MLGRVIVVWMSFALLGCSDAADKKTLGEACTRSEQCASALRCVTGACAAPADDGDAG